MSSKKTELDVDFIGGLGSLTPAEEKALSGFFKKRKITTKPSADKTKSKKVKRSKIAA